MLKMSYFHTNTHTETFVTLTRVIDDTDGLKCRSRSGKFTTRRRTEAALDCCLAWF